MFAKTILWIEDSPDTVTEQRLYCQRAKLRVEMVNTVMEFSRILEENATNIGLIVVDIMLYGVRTLGNYGSRNADTGKGYNAGWAIIEWILRPRGPRAPYSRIPIVILSSRPRGAEEDRRLNNLEILRKKRGDSQITYIEKGGRSADGRQSWEKEFEEVVNRLFGVGRFS